MARLFRWLVRLVFVLIAGIGLVIFGSYWFASRSLPEYELSLTVDGVTAPVEVVRDRSAVPHVFGQSDNDVYFGLGFAHAQDRLWQMIVFRRAVQGRLSEILGPKTLRSDELMRRYDFYNLAVASVAAQDDYTKAALEAYSKGVNAWLKEVNAGARGRGAPEFWMFSPKIAPWQPADSIAIVKMMALQMSNQLQNEVLRARVSLMLPEERVKDILPDAPGEAIAALPEYAALFPQMGAERQVAMLDPGPLYPGPEHADFGGASNAWAAAPGRSAAGGSLLANDPHLGLSAPSLWYLAHLDLQGGGVIGATIPGVPAVFLGRSEALGWGMTASAADDADLFIEQVNPDNPAEVRTPGGWKAMRTRPSIINIEGQTPQTITLQWTDNGPVLPEWHAGIGKVTPPGHVAALGWTAFLPQDTTLSAAMGLMRAQDVDGALKAAELAVAPSFNLVVADRDRIAMKTIGALPLRDAGNQSLGRLPVPGWRAVNRWQGFMSYASNPAFVDPEGGIVGSTNNKIVDRPFPAHVSYDWGDTQRIQRWRRLMQSRQVHTRESFIEAQLDTVSFTARSLLPLIARDLWFTGEAAPEGTKERQRQRALELLADWNGEMNEHLPEPLIYAAWVRALQTRLIRDEMGPLEAEFRHIEPLFIERVFRDVNGAATWCDVIQSAPVETCDDMARLALDDALVWIGEHYGTQLESLRWGDAHEAVQDHPVLGRVPVLNWVTNIRQSTSGGDFTLNRGLTSGTGPDPFENVQAAGYRGVYDFADPESSVFIISTGQSGHPLSRHYDDLGVLWRRGEYIPMTLDADLARAGAIGTAWLRPR